MNDNYHILTKNYRNNPDDLKQNSQGNNAILGDIASSHQLLPKHSEAQSQIQYTDNNNINTDNTRYQQPIHYVHTVPNIQQVQKKEMQNNDTNSPYIELSPEHEPQQVMNEDDKKVSKSKIQKSKPKKNSTKSKTKVTKNKPNVKKLVINFVVIPVILIITFIVLAHPRINILNKYVSDIGSTKGIFLRAIILAVVYIVMILATSFIYLINNTVFFIV